MHRRLNDRPDLIHDFVGPIRPLADGLHDDTYFVELLVGPLRELRYVPHHLMALLHENMKFFLQICRGDHQLFQFASQMEGDGNNAERQDDERDGSKE
jgi:hypothetical protein